MSPLAQEYARYADLILREIEALSRHDVPALENLSAQRQQLAARVQHLPADLDALPVLEHCAELHSQFVAELARLKTTVFQDLKAMGHRRSALLAYGSAAPGQASFDVRF